MAVDITEQDLAELRDEMRKRGHNVDVDITHEPDGTPHIHIHIRGPLWWAALRWLLLYPTTLPHRVMGWLDDRVVWHVVRGHHVEHGVLTGEANGPMHMWDSYCETCEMAW